MNNKSHDIKNWLNVSTIWISMWQASHNVRIIHYSYHSLYQSIYLYLFVSLSLSLFISGILKNMIIIQMYIYAFTWCQSMRFLPSSTRTLLWFRMSEFKIVSVSYRIINSWYFYFVQNNTDVYIEIKMRKIIFI